MMSKKNVYLSDQILNSLIEKPQTTAELAQRFETHHENVRKRLARLKSEGLVHIAEYRISELRSNQPTKVFGAGSGQDAERITKCELEMIERKTAKKAEFVPRRDPFIAAFFGAAQA
jgi:predicted ArsR family transcriptional regulator